MKTLNSILLTIVFTLFVLVINAQNRTITGVITGTEGSIAGVSITDLQNNTKAISNADGTFSISIPNADTHLEFKLKKMKTTILVTENENNLKVTLIPTDKKLYKTLSENEEMRLCDLYLNNYPNGEFINEVKALKEKLFFIEAYNIAASQFSDTALQNYLRMYPDGNYKQKAQDAIEIAAWQKAKFNNTADSYQEYLNQYPNGKASGIAKEKLAELK